MAFLSVICKQIAKIHKCLRNEKNAQTLPIFDRIKDFLQKYVSNGAVHRRRSLQIEYNDPTIQSEIRNVFVFHTHAQRAFNVHGQNKDSNGIVVSWRRADILSCIVWLSYSSPMELKEKISNRTHTGKRNWQCIDCKPHTHTVSNVRVCVRCFALCCCYFFSPLSLVYEQFDKNRNWNAKLFVLNVRTFSSGNVKSCISKVQINRVKSFFLVERAREIL